MSTRWTFRRHAGRRSAPGRLEAHFAAGEAELLTSLLEQVVQLLEDDTPPDTDPFAASIGIGTATTVPEDPALARLLPDAYGDDPEAAGDFRRYTERGLRARKQESARRALATLATVDTTQELSEEDALAWLGALNDARLTLGARLQVTEDTFTDELDPDDPDYAALLVYDYLGWLQESLLGALGEPS